MLAASCSCGLQILRMASAIRMPFKNVRRQDGVSLDARTCGCKIDMM